MMCEQTENPLNRTTPHLLEKIITKSVYLFTRLITPYRYISDENLLLTKLLTQVAFHFAKRQYDDTLM